MPSVRIAPAPPPATDYDVIVADRLIEELGARVLVVAPAHRYAVLADARIADGHGAAVVASLERVHARAELIRVPTGEALKTRETWGVLSDELLRRGFGRDGCIVAVGGGVTGDVAGFVAATFLRGIPVVQVPTTLLAMVDACIGGKTGVDTPAGKNLIGAFHQPRLVAIDPHVLVTLPDAELRAGLAECIKHGAIADAAYMQWIGDDSASIFARDSDAIVRLVQRSVEIKAEFVNRDPFERGPRKALNFGHTIAHALETELDYGLSHGSAVAIGCVVEARIGELLQVTHAGAAERIAAVLERVGLPTQVPAGVSIERLIERTRSDKKARAGAARYTLLRDVGAVAAGEDWSFAVPDETASAAAAQQLRPE